MKILIVTGKCYSLYREQMIVNLKAKLIGSHDIVFYKITKKYKEQIKSENPDIVYMLVGGTEYTDIVEMFKGTKTILVSDAYDTLDFYIHGEPEQVFPLFVEAIEQRADLSTVPGITYKHKTEKAEKWDINQVVSDNSFTTFSTRGCRGSCSFCSIKDYQGPLRYRDIPVIVKDILQFSKYDNFQGDFCFSDPSFDSNPKKRMKEILKTLAKEFPGYTYQANFRPDFHKMVDKNMADLLFDSGLTRAFVGIESGNAEDLKLYNKGTTVEDAQETVEFFKWLDCSVDIGFIMVNPFSDFNRLRANVDFLKRNHLGTFDALTRPLQIYRTPIWQTVKEAGLTLPNNPYYKFKDEKMLMFITTIQLIERELHQNALAQYRDLSLKDVKRLKRQALFRSGEDKYNKMGEFDQQLTGILERESDRLCEWFLNLLDLMEQQKPYKDFFTMTFDYVTTEHIKSVVKEYNAPLKEMRKEYGEVEFMMRV